MDIGDVLICTGLKVTRPIHITLNNFVSEELWDVLFGGGGLTERDMREGVKNVHFIRDVLNGCSLPHW